jgi:hypothetical protein
MQGKPRNRAMTGLQDLAFPDTGERPWWERDDAWQAITPGAVPDHLLAAAGDLLYDLSRYYGAARASEYEMLKMLFGFPAVPRWTERALSKEARSAALRWELDLHVNHFRSMSPETGSAWDRARDRNQRKYEGEQEACDEGWMVIYCYLLHYGASDIRCHPDLWGRRALARAVRSRRRPS